MKPTKFYQWILRNNQEFHYPRFIVTESYYPNEELVRAHCCMESLYSPLRRLDESEIDIAEAPYLEWMTVSEFPATDTDDPWELRAHAEEW